MADYGADPQVVPSLLYEDAGTAMDWLIAVFGFTERVRDRQGDGTVRHGELLLDNGGVIMLGSPGGAFRGPARLGGVTQLQCITVTDLMAHRERAQAAGAEASEVSMRANRAGATQLTTPRAIAGTSASRFRTVALVNPLPDGRPVADDGGHGHQPAGRHVHRGRQAL